MEYIAIKNWDKYQADSKGHLREGYSPWIKDWVDKEADREYSDLTCLQRYLYDALRRLRGKLGKNPANDPIWIGRILSIHGRERKHIPQAINRLLELGLIRLSSQPLQNGCDTADEPLPIGCNMAGERPDVGTPLEPTTSLYRVDKRRIEKEKEVEPSSTTSESIAEDTERHPTRIVEGATEEDTAARSILDKFSVLSGTNIGSLVRDENVRDCAVKLAGQHKLPLILSAMESVMTEGWWADKITTFPFFYEHFEEKLLPAYTANERGKKAQQKQQAKTTAPGAHGNTDSKGTRFLS